MKKPASVEADARMLPEMAELVLALAEHLDEERYGSRRVVGLRGQALAIAGNASWIAGCLARRRANRVPRSAGASSARSIVSCGVIPSGAAR
jgi:hypothetical protein